VLHVSIPRGFPHRVKPQCPHREGWSYSSCSTPSQSLRQYWRQRSLTCSSVSPRLYAGEMTSSARSIRIKTTAQISRVSPISRFIWQPRWKTSSERCTPTPPLESIPLTNERIDDIHSLPAIGA
jgi:hypothetical protein